MLGPCLLQAPPDAASPFGGSFLLMLVLLGAGYWFLILRPMTQQRRKQQDLQRSVKPGDRILTTSGLYGTVAKLRDDRILLRIADGVQVELARQAISTVLSGTDQE